jgi:RNA polymerase sigma-70 factor (ECF subfamily)
MAEQSRFESWVVAARQGDRFALAKLLATCDPRLRARAAACLDADLRARRGPEDILQEAYLEVARQIHRFEGRDLGSFLAWVRTILDHKLIDARRAAHCQARDVQREVPAMLGSSSSSYWNLLDNLYRESGTPSRVIRREEALAALLSCVDNLSEAQRRVIQMRFLDGLSVDEVARRLDKSPAAVVALSQRALEALRAAMDRLGEFTHGA